MIEIERRKFLRLLVAVPIGIAVGPALSLTGGALVEGMQEVTGQPAGNAGFQDFIEESCKDSADPEACAENFQIDGGLKDAITVIGPVIEEGIFRSIPSFVLDLRDKTEENPFGNQLYGTGGLSMTRREIAYGITSSLIFGVSHNFTIKGFNTNTLPAPLAIMGFGLWYLQRKLGILSNTAAHIVNNTLSISS